MGSLLSQVRAVYRDPTKLWEGWVEVHRDAQNLFFVEQPYHDSQGCLQWITLSSGTTEQEALQSALDKRHGCAHTD